MQPKFAINHSGELKPIILTQPDIGIPSSTNALAAVITFDYYSFQLYSFPSSLINATLFFMISLAFVNISITVLAG